MTAGAAADALVSTPAERAALDALRDAAGEVNGPMERHGVRIHRIVCEMAGRRGEAIDPEVVAVTAFLHDAGLYDRASRGGVYVKDGAEFAREVLEPFGWSEDRLRLCADAIERHHELRPQWSRGAEVELVRRADLVDLMGGIVGWGVSRPWLRPLNAEVPRDGAYREVARLLGHAARERPLTLPRIFLR